MSNGDPVESLKAKPGGNIKVRNRLRELMQQPGGRSVVEALRGAQKRLGNIKGECLEGLDRLIARMAKSAAELSDPPQRELVDDIYMAANEVIAIAGLVEFEVLDEVAHGLCELIDLIRADNLTGGLAIRVHVDALQLLRGLNKEDEAGRTQVMTGLRQVWARFGVPYKAEPSRQNPAVADTSRG